MAGKVKGLKGLDLRLRVSVGGFRSRALRV